MPVLHGLRQVRQRFQGHDHRQIHAHAGSLLHQMREGRSVPGRRQHRQHLAVERRARGVVQRHAPPATTSIPDRRSSTASPSRIEIISLGGLVSGLSSDDLLNGICQPRNPELANAFALLGWSQNCGVGIQRIMDAYADASDYHSAARRPGIGRRRPADTLAPASVHRRRRPRAHRRQPGSHRPNATRSPPCPARRRAPRTPPGRTSSGWRHRPPASASPAASLEAMTLRLLATARLPALPAPRSRPRYSWTRTAAPASCAIWETTGQGRPAGALPRHAVSPRLTRHGRAAPAPRCRPRPPGVGPVTPSGHSTVTSVTLYGLTAMATCTCADDNRYSLTSCRISPRGGSHVLQRPLVPAARPCRGLDAHRRRPPPQTAPTPRQPRRHVERDLHRLVADIHQLDIAPRPLIAPWPTRTAVWVLPG